MTCNWLFNFSARSFLTSSPMPSLALDNSSKSSPLASASCIKALISCCSWSGLWDLICFSRDCRLSTNSSASFNLCSRSLLASSARSTSPCMWSRDFCNSTSWFSEAPILSFNGEGSKPSWESNGDRWLCSALAFPKSSLMAFSLSLASTTESFLSFGVGTSLRLSTRSASFLRALRISSSIRLLLVTLASASSRAPFLDDRLASKSSHWDSMSLNSVWIGSLSVSQALIRLAKSLESFPKSGRFESASFCCFWSCFLAFLKADFSEEFNFNLESCAVVNQLTSLSLWDPYWLWRSFALLSFVSLSLRSWSLSFTCVSISLRSSSPGNDAWISLLRAEMSAAFCLSPDFNSLFFAICSSVFPLSAEIWKSSGNLESQLAMSSFASFTFSSTSICFFSFSSDTRARSFAALAKRSCLFFNSLMISHAFKLSQPNSLPRPRTFSPSSTILSRMSLVSSTSVCNDLSSLVCGSSWSFAILFSRSRSFFSASSAFASSLDAFPKASFSLAFLSATTFLRSSQSPLRSFCCLKVSSLSALQASMMSP